MKTTLGEIAVKNGIQTGPFGSQLHASDYVDAGVGVVMPQDLRGNVVSLDEIAFVSSATADALQRHQLCEGDIVYSRRGDITRRALIRGDGPELLCGTGCLRVRIDKTVANPAFVSYFLGLPKTHEWLYQHAVGATMPNLNTSILSEVPVSLPALGTQRAIGEVLGALDDKIAANRRVVDAGDFLLRALYSSTPKASAGRTFADVAAVGGGGTPSTKNPLYWDGVVGWATPTDVTGADGPWLAHTTRRISEEGLNNCASPLYPEGSILMTSRATIGAVVVARKPMAVNQGFIVLNAVESEMQWWLESQVRARTTEFETWANGATFLEISRGTFKKLPVLECSPGDLERFNRTAQAVRERQSSCQAENVRLAGTRDELLPLLMNGRITVEDAERAAEPVL